MADAHPTEIATAPFRDEAGDGKTALLIIDMLNEMNFGDAEGMREEAERTADAVLRLRDAADRAEVPVIYVNDNFGEWHSERGRLVERALAKAGADSFVARVRPREDDFFVIKPQFSGFYATNLPVLLPKLGVRRLVLTGIAGDICVLFTAADAHMRDYDLWVPADAIATATPERHDWALQIMARAMGAEVRPTRELTLGEWLDVVEP